MNKHFMEDTLGLSNSSKSAIAKQFEKMNVQLEAANGSLNIFRNCSEICRRPELMSIITEAAKIKDVPNLNKYQAEDVRNLNTLFENVGTSLLNEAVQSTGDLSPIMVNSFGIQERALISSHLPRAVKQVIAKIDNFKLSERIPFITDLSGKRTRFIDMFGYGKTAADMELSRTVAVNIMLPVTGCIDIKAGNTDGDSDTFNWTSIDSAEVLGTDTSVARLYDSAGKEVDFSVGPDSTRTPSVENGMFKVSADVYTAATGYVEKTAYYSKSADGTYTKVAIADAEAYAAAGDLYTVTPVIVSGQFDLSKGQLVYATSTNTDVIAGIGFDVVLSPETHIRALSVGYEMKHTPVNIPIGEHFEFSLSEEYKEASEKYYNIDAMSKLTDLMGIAVEQVKDIKTLDVYQKLAKSAVYRTTFNCKPDTYFAQGKEEYIKREFAPFIEKTCILLKDKVRIPNCHFRVLGNPLDIRIAASAGVEYIYKRNEAFAGDIAIDYEFCVTSDTHKIFYLSSERVPVGKIFIFLIPNSIEDNISTVNHYEYSTYVSNKYRSTQNPNLPTVMISTRYLTKEYYPVLGVVDVVNNVSNDGWDEALTSGAGNGLDIASQYGNKVQYVQM